MNPASGHNVSYYQADLRDSPLGGNIGTHVCSYSSVDFSHANLRGTAHGFALYADCNFSYADLNSVDFDGARFQRCKFASRKP